MSDYEGRKMMEHLVKMCRALPSLQLVACLLNISEAHNKTVVESVAHAALTIPCNSNDPDVKCPATVLNIFSDYDYNRSVISIVAPVENIEESVYKACSVAYEKIDLSKHSGGHPRLGSVDLIPIHPLTGDVSLNQCGTIALSIAERIVRQIQGTSMFLFGHADKPSKRGLVERRKTVKWFDGRQGVNFKTIGWDLGPAPSPRHGCTGIGAIPYVTNCNVTIDCKDLKLGKALAKSIRATSPGGLPGVQSMAFEHEERIEIACNIESQEVRLLHIKFVTIYYLKTAWRNPQEEKEHYQK